MDPIVTLTFHPCIDVNTTVAALAPEIKLICSTPLLHPGGGGINVARAIRKLGGAATPIYMAGGSNGQKLTALLAQEGIKSIVFEASGPTRENLIIKESSTGLQYRFNLPGPGVKLSALVELLALLKSAEGIAFLVVSGSLAPGMSTDIFDKLATIAERKHIKLIVDTSGEALEAAIDRGAYLIKPSLKELLSLTRKEEFSLTKTESLFLLKTDGASGSGNEVTEAACIARQIVAKGKCGALVVSLGGEGALLVTRDTVRHIPTPRVKVISTVGAGDSLLAGIVLSLQRGKNLEEAVAYGCLCGAAATTRPGTSLCSLADVESLQTIDACP